MDTQDVLSAEPTVLINIIEVDEGKEEEFFAPWKVCSEYLKQQDGYISHRFHKSPDAGARFKYVNVAVWKSPRHFQVATDSPTFRELVQHVPCKSEIQVYRVIEYEHKVTL